MKTTHALLSIVIAASATMFATHDARADDNAACGQLVGGSGSATPGGGFALRGGEPVDLVAGGQTTHGTLLVFADGSMFRAYWQPQGSQEKYALANAGANSIRLVSTPPQGAPADSGKPGITLPALQVMSCPTL